MSKMEGHYSVAERRELLAYFAPLPDPQDWFENLPMAAVESLSRTYPCGKTFICHSESDAANLRIFGIVECGGHCLTVFGIDVRNVAREWGVL